MRRRETRFGTAGAAGLLCSLPLAGLAQPGDPAPASAAAVTAPDDASSQVQEIVVTAQRREQSILQVPVAVTALTDEALQSRGIANSSQLAMAVPNLQINSSFGDTQPNFSLRGVSVANEYNSNQVSPVGVYVNDVYIVSRASQGMGLFDLDRVEVLRGPQGTLFGRNTTGGAINFITRAPSLAGSNGYIETGYGNFNTFKVDGAAETTLADGQLGLRGAINYATGHGQFENVYPDGRDEGSTNTLQGRISLRVHPSDSALDIRLTGYGSHNNPTQAPVFGLQTFRQGLDYFQVDENRVGHFETKSQGVSVNLTYGISPALKLISITSYDTGLLNLQQAADGSPLDILNIHWESHFKQFSEEARLNYSSEALNLIGGFYVGTDDTVTDNTFYIGSLLAPGVDGGFYQHYDQFRHSYAGFAQGDINVSSQLVLTLGVRYTADRSQYYDGSADLFAGSVYATQTPLFTTVPCAGVPGTCPYDSTARYALRGQNDATTGRAALSYTFDNGMLAYVSYNRGYRAGAFNGGGYTSSSGITYIQPETVNAYEAGLKGRLLDRKLSLAVATYYYDYRNQQVQDTRPGPVSFLVNAPKSEIYGAELEATWRPVAAFDVNGSVGLLHAQYKNLTLQNTNLSGNDLPFAPHVTAQLSFDWHVVGFAGGMLTLSPAASYSSHQYFSPFNSINAVGSGQVNSELEQSAFTKVNASLAWGDERLTIRLWSNNLFDARTLGYGLDLRGAGFPYNFLVPEAPRTYGLSARFNF
jgi:iron complex outermembrane receptor protein